MTAASGTGKKKKGSLVTPLRPGDLVPTASSLGEGRAVKTKPVTEVKNQPRWLCCQPFTGEASATGVYLSPVTWVCHWKSKDKKITSWHYGSGKIKISARKYVQLGDCGKTKRSGGCLGAEKADTPIAGRVCMVAFWGLTRGTHGVLLVIRWDCQEAR